MQHLTLTCSTHQLCIMLLLHPRCTGTRSAHIRKGIGAKGCVKTERDLSAKGLVPGGYAVSSEGGLCWVGHWPLHVLTQTSSTELTITDLCGE